MTELTRDEKVLRFDPFEDDADVTTLRNRMVTTRKPHECHNCGDAISPGTRVRSLTQTFEGNVMTWWWCGPCCDAMATYYDPEDMDEDGNPTFLRRCKPLGRAVEGAR